MSSMSLVNGDLVSFFTGYDIDKIVRVDESSFNVAAATTVAGYLKKHSIAHGFTRPVFTDLLWSKDGVNWIDGGIGTGPNTFNGTIAYSDSTHIHILTMETTGTLYYKVISFWITNYDSTDPLVPAYVQPNKSVVFDSRLNYQKIFLQGQGTLSTPSVTHYLGYEPNYRVYIESLLGEVWPMNWGGTQNPFLYDFANHRELNAYSTDTQLIFDNFGFTGTRRIWYRIYADE